MKYLFIIVMIGIALLLLYILLTFIASYFFIRILVHPKHLTNDEGLNYEIEHNRIKKDNYETNYKREDFTVKSNYGYDLVGFYIPKQVNVDFKDGKERAVILVHGWTSNKYSPCIYGDLYLKLGFHVFTYDHRNHGASGIAPTTMGDKEADDLDLIVKMVKNKFNGNVIIGTQGESMGSGTVMIHAGRYQDIDFVVEDCGYSDLKKLLVFQCNEVRHFPPFPTLLFGRLFFYIMTKSTYKKVSPAKEIQHLDNIPMYFVHGEADRFVPLASVYECYEAKSGPKMLTTYPNSQHAKSVQDHNEEYFINLKTFLEKFNII